MTWLDWMIVIIPMVLLIGVAIYSRKYARGVVIFLPPDVSREGM